MQHSLSGNRRKQLRLDKLATLHRRVSLTSLVQRHIRSIHNSRLNDRLKLPRLLRWRSSNIGPDNGFTMGAIGDSRRHHCSDGECDLQR